MRFEKYESTGNDFLLCNTKELENQEVEMTVEALSDLARRVTHRHFGFGADGILVLGQSGTSYEGFGEYETRDNAHCRMFLVNSDGSHAEMSGNGVRCFAAYAADHGYGEETSSGPQLVRVETRAGIKEIILRADNDGRVGDVDMGPVTFEPDNIPVIVDDAFSLTHELLGKQRNGYAVNSGVPHWVLVLDTRDELEDEALAHQALVARYDERFPELTNVSIAVVESPDRIHARVFERGAHETLSCGTGATAIAAALRNAGLVNNSVTVSLRGGELLVSMSDTNILSGPVNAIGRCDYEY